MGGFYTDYSYIGIMPDGKKQIFATEKEYKDFLKERKDEMDYQELVKYLEAEIKKCEENDTVYREYDLAVLWSKNSTREEALKEILNKVQGS